MLGCPLQPRQRLAVAGHGNPVAGNGVAWQVGAVQIRPADPDDSYAIGA